MLSNMTAERTYEVCGAGGEIAPYTDHRLLVGYGEKLCPIIRFAIASDGSVNFSPYLKGASEIATQALTSSDTGNLNVEYGRGEVTHKDEIKGGNLLKVNYHASGFIHYGNQRRYGPPLRGLSRTIEVALMIVMHPIEMGVIEKSAVRNTDMVTGFKARDSAPLHVRFSIAPLSTPCELPTTNLQFWAQRLIARDLEGEVPDLQYNFQIFDSSNGPWPPECGVLFPANDAPITPIS